MVTDVYQDTRRCRPCNNAYQREYKKNNREKILAQHLASRLRIYRKNKRQRVRDAANSMTGYWVKTGKLVKEGCEVCGEASEAHHDSYAKRNWLKVRFLCVAHHAEWHRFNEPTY